MSETPAPYGTVTRLAVVLVTYNRADFIERCIASICSAARPGLLLRATGDAPATVDAQGGSVARIRWVHTIAGGALMAFGGAWYMFARGAAWNAAATTNGIGWIALALVVFASWRPLRAIGGAVLFGFTLQVPFTLQAEQISVLPPTIVAMFPYLVTLAVLVVLSTPRARRLLGAPKMLGQPFVRDER